MFDEAAQVLGHPLRQRLLFEYHEPSSPSKVARRIKERVNLVSYHTNVLYRHGWIEMVGTEPRRGATEHFYRSIGSPYIEDEDWERISVPLRRAFVLGIRGVASEELRAAVLHGGFDAATAHFSRSLLDLDEHGVAEVAVTLREVIDKLQNFTAASRERDPAGGERHEVVIQFFRVPPSD
jgi:DNA-binding transcriptional ArsR family regulator